MRIVNVNVNPAISVNPFVTVADRALIMLSHATTRRKRRLKWKLSVNNFKNDRGGKTLQRRRQRINKQTMKSQGKKNIPSREKLSVSYTQVLLFVRQRKISYFIVFAFYRVRLLLMIKRTKEYLIFLSFKLFNISVVTCNDWWLMNNKKDWGELNFFSMISSERVFVPGWISALSDSWLKSSTIEFKTWTILHNV